MKTVRLFVLVMFIAMGMQLPARAASGTTLVVMPVRYTVVQFAFDIARIRPTSLVAYDKGTGDEPLLLHVWDTAAGAWKPATVAEYQGGTLFAAKPKQAFLIGSESDLPAELSDASGWCKDVTRVPTLKVMDMANAMNGKLKFSDSEWNRLAKRHNLDLIDENADLRRYGRYGKPGTQPTGPRPVNPLLARFRRAEKEPVPSEEPTTIEEEIQVAPVETPQPVVTPTPVEAPAPVEVEEKDTGVPVASEKAPAVEAETPAEFK